MREPTQAELDAALERMIHTAYLASINSRDPELQRAGCDALTRLVAQRSPKQIEPMEAKAPGALALVKGLLMYAYGRSWISFETTECVARVLRRWRWFREG